MRPILAATLFLLGAVALGCSPAKSTAAAARPPAPVAGPPADAAHPVVVELFTSQGCSSCPPAEAYLAQLSNRPEVLALSFAVTYWDDQGWKDTFGDPAYTDRQTAYVKSLGGDGDYTPQIVVNGAADAVGSRRPAVEALIRGAGRPVGPALALTPGGATLAAGAWNGPPADVWLVRYDRRTVQVPIGRGENGGRTLPQKNVVHGLRRLGAWSGKPMTFSFPVAGGGLSTAVLVQRPGGQIVAAARD